MAFKIASLLDGTHPPFEYYLGKDGEAFALGEALVMDGGRLIKCGPTTTPEFICLKTQAAETPAKTLLPVTRVTETQEYEAPIGAATPFAVIVGSKLTLHTDGLSLTDSTEGGVFLVSGNPKGEANVAVGDRIAGFFRR